MRVFTLNFPKHDNQGASLDALALELRKALCKVAGGFTMAPDQVGGWIDPDTGTLYLEPVDSYRVAFHGEHTRLVALALEYGRRADQKAVYVEIDGEPLILNCHPNALEV